MSAAPMVDAWATSSLPVEEPPATTPNLDLYLLAQEAEEDAETTLVMPAAWLDALRVQSRPEKPRWAKPAPPRSIEVVDLDPDEIVVVDEDERAETKAGSRDSGMIALDCDVDVDMAFEALKSA